MKTSFLYIGSLGRPRDVVVFDVLYLVHVEIFQLVDLQVLLHEVYYSNHARFQHFERVATHSAYFTIIPDVSVQQVGLLCWSAISICKLVFSRRGCPGNFGFSTSAWRATVGKRSFWNYGLGPFEEGNFFDKEDRLGLLIFDQVIHFDNVGGEDEGNRCTFGCMEVHDVVVKLEQDQNLYGCLAHILVIIKSHQAEVPVQKVDGSDEIEVKAELHKNLLLEFYEFLLLDLDSLELLDCIYHIIEVRLPWLFKLGSYKQASAKECVDKFAVYRLCLSN